MEYNLLTNIEICRQFKELAPMNLIYYSHIPTAILALLIGIFVFLKNKKSLLNIILFGIALSFSLWSWLDLLNWEYGYNSTLTMVSWSLLGLVQAILFMLSLYFVSIFPNGKDVSFFKKSLIALASLPIIILTPTRYNLTSFTVVDCEAIEGSIFTNYYYIFSLFIFFLVLVIGFIKYKRAEKEIKKQIILMITGIELFLFSFFISGYISSYLGDYTLLIYGMFGMVIFMGFLAYMIVKFKAFNIKLLGVQALIVGQFIAIAAMLAFVTNLTNQILISVTLVLTLVMGWNLIRSVKKEVKAREELEVVNEELAERKGELQTMSDKLSQSNDQLRKLDNAKSEFISIASHQLRTPLTAIKGFISMLLEGSYGKLVPDQEVVLNKVYTSNERLVTLVEDLLNVSRIESGRMEFRLANCQLADVCQEVFDTFAMRAKEHNLYLEYKRPEIDFPEVLVDKVKVREVISNLVDNALKYTLDGHGGVTIKLSRMDDHLRVTVSDTGIGIPKTELPYLFAKFSSGKDIGRLNTGGTGLGLYVGKAMIENNGGRVWAESDGEGKGSRFIIELPLTQSEELIKKWG